MKFFSENDYEDNLIKYYGEDHKDMAERREEILYRTGSYWVDVFIEHLLFLLKLLIIGVVFYTFINILATKISSFVLKSPQNCQQWFMEELKNRGY